MPGRRAPLRGDKTSTAEHVGNGTRSQATGSAHFPASQSPRTNLSKINMSVHEAGRNTVLRGPDGKSLRIYSLQENQLSTARDSFLSAWTCHEAPILGQMLWMFAQGCFQQQSKADRPSYCRWASSNQRKGRKDGSLSRGPHQGLREFSACTVGAGPA